MNQCWKKTLVQIRPTDQTWANTAARLKGLLA